MSKGAQNDSDLPSTVVSDKTEHPELWGLREGIDLMDAALVAILAERMRIVEKIAKYKAKAGLEFYDPERWEGIVDAKVKKGTAVGVDEELMRDVYEAIKNSGLRINDSIRS